MSEILHPEGWAAPRGYAHGVSAPAGGKVVVTAGQIGWDPATNRFSSDDFVEQAAQALRNVVAVLHEGGARPEHLVRLTWFIVSAQDYMKARASLGAAYREIMDQHYPAMSVVVVSALLEPEAKVEIEATAVVPE